ncbi:TetR family transcriptional regulator [Rhodoferax antarcticus]|uniref:Transcriptional regulator, TetR family n=1 Tax=Rhodoferax antarcticus ANT.BR TaxID=1111071 RepID=A0A1Q8YDM2_9BURK|nr:TetR family transcriptional regulator [Rhodoferax antarcticus]APW45976.1 TetR family transcriptional regulator [Rhodoferax antarcticus]MCW2310475.1 TetR/AcrR family acrAB operon transcriptional repressor [Rhodoferax antarcticus]OLP06103.1 Transcriptional regulator, TetR family [Rhodoferax antarcticus ANT.BR]
MARRTKADAQATRQQLLQAAVRVFAEKGVSRTSLQDIAEAAGTTRGAIYWHFKNKADLFNAMMDDALLPMEQAMQHIGHDPAQDPLAELEYALLQTMRDIVSNASTRAVFEIAIMKVEYVDELLGIKERHIQAFADGTREITRSLREAAGRRGIHLPVNPEVAAHGLHALMVGLIHSWMLSPEAFDLVVVSQSAVRAQLAGLGLHLSV